MTSALHQVIFLVTGLAIAAVLVMVLLQIWDPGFKVDARIWLTLTIIVVLGLAYAILAGAMGKKSSRK